MSDTLPRAPAWPPASAPRLFVAQKLAADARIKVEGRQAHYLASVMRVSLGDTIIVCDDTTGEWAASVEAVDKRRVDLTTVQKLRAREAVPDFWLCPALLKKDRFDLVLEKSCELGAAAIRPVITRRCVADKLNPQRARAILTEAAEQCARTALPALEEPQKLPAMLRAWPKDRVLFFADEERDAAPAVEAFTQHRGPAALLTGPEGGFDPQERALLKAHEQVVAISLGPRILRGETATIAALAVWMATSGDWAATGPSAGPPAGSSSGLDQAK